MNKLLSLGLVFTVAAAVLCRQMGVQAAARRDARHLATQNESLARDLDNSRDQAGRLETDLATERDRARTLRQDLADWDAHTEPAVELPDSLGPGQCWPTNQPWCYLSKSTLTRIGFMTFAQDGRMTDQAALLFGMSSAQRARVEDAYAEFCRDLQAVDLAYLHPTTIPDELTHMFDDYHWHSYLLDIPSERLAALRDGFESAVRDSLPGQQGELFLQANQRFLHIWFNELDACPLRITCFTPPEKPQEGDDALLVEVQLTPSAGVLRGNGKCLYPEDETAFGYQRYAALLRTYEGPLSR